MHHVKQICSGVLFPYRYELLMLESVTSSFFFVAPYSGNFLGDDFNAL
jgi:hypothetical protein